MLVVKRLYGWRDEEVEHFVSDSLVLRQFCRVYLEKVADATTLLRWANLIAPATREAPNEHVVALARGLQVTRGRKLRLDSTVVATTLHHPSDSRLRYDGVRVLSRLLRRARRAPGATAGQLGQAVFRTRTRSARRLVQSRHRLGRRKGGGAGHATGLCPDDRGGAQDAGAGEAGLLGVAHPARGGRPPSGAAARNLSAARGARASASGTPDDPAPPNAARPRGNAGSGAAFAAAPGSKAGSVSCSAPAGSIVVAILARPGWAAGSVGGS